MRHDPCAVANYFLDRSDASGKTVTPMQLNKLVYFAHGWSLALLGAPLLDAEVQAWKYGPVIPSVYEAFKRFGNRPISEPASSFEPFDDDGGDLAPITSNFTHEQKRLMDKIWSTYGHLSGYQLSELTHREGTPWSEVYKSDARNLVVPDLEIEKSFKDEAKKNRERRAQPQAAE